MIRLSSWDVVANAFATRSRARGAQTIGHIGAPERSLGFWIALWALVIAAEFAALVPVIWPDEEQVETVQVIYRLIGSPGELNYGTAMAASVVLAAATALVILLVEPLRVPGVGVI